METVYTDMIVTCKEDLFIQVNNKSVGFKKNKSYNSVHENWHNGIKTIFVYYDDIDKWGARFFYKNDLGYQITSYEYGKYFYTEQELRKLKLKKLNK